MSTVCRVCLTGGDNVTQCSLEDVRLQDVYKKLTDTQFHSEDGRSRVVCYSCYKNLLKCWTLWEMACKSEKIISNLLFKGLEATHETIENLNLGPKQRLLQLTDLDSETPKNSSAIFIKQEPIFVKEEETVQVDELVDTESADTLIPEECIKTQLIIEEDNENEIYWIKNSTEINIVNLKLEPDTEKRDSDQEPIQIQKVEVDPDQPKMYYCDICRKMFLVRSKLVSHIQLSHAKDQQRKTLDKKLEEFHFDRSKSVHTGDKQYGCKICDKQFTHNSSLLTHMRGHTGEKPFACSICDKQFAKKSYLVRHMRIHTGVKPYACSICDKNFNQKSHLVTHMRVHTGERPHACSICDKKYSLKSHLITHMRVHTGERPYVCGTCNKQFTKKSHLVRHMRVHPEVKPYACSMCDKQFKHESTLVNHMGIHTGVKKAKANTKPRSCGICDKQFTKKCHLDRHMRIHSGVKPYACSTCDKQFNEKYNLVRHMRLHTGVKPCSI